MTQTPAGAPRLTLIDDAAASAAATPRPEAPLTTPQSGGPADRAKVVIVGSGPAGLTAAIYAARANLAPIVLGGYAPGGQLMITSDVENYPGFVEPIEGPELMARFRAQAERVGARVLDVDVERVDLSRRPFGLWAGGQEYRAEAVIIATGASALWLGLPNETRLRGKGVSACATCDGFFFRGKKVVVVGGGDTAMEEALFLTRFATEVVIIHRRDKFRAEKIMVNRLLEKTVNGNVRVEWHSTLEEVLGNDKFVTGVRIHNTETNTSKTLDIDGVFIAIG